MRPRRRHSHFRRQTGVIFQPGGGLLLDSGVQGGATGGNTDEQQQPANTASEIQPSATERAQPAHHAVPSMDPQLSSPVLSNVHSLSSILLATSSLANVANIRPTASLAGSSVQSSNLSIHHSSSSPSSSISASASATSSASQISSAASLATHVDATGRSVEFYGSIAFAVVVALACIIAFAAWLIRSRRKGSACCCGGGDDEDVENQDLGHGLGLYLDKHEDGFDSQNVSTTPFPELTRGNFQANLPVPPTFRDFVNSPGRIPTATMRPPATHTFTDDSIHTPNQLLGPLQIKNYVSGDFPSSCDEAVSTPKHGCGSGYPRGPRSVRTPHFPGIEGQGLFAPWAPLNIKSSRTPNQVNIVHSVSKKSEVVQPDGEEICPLPMPPFDITQSRKDCERESPNGWGATLRSSIYGALSGMGGNASKSEEGESMALPGSYSHSDRWRNALSSRKSAGADVLPLGSHSSNACRTLMSPSSHQHIGQFGQGTATLDSIGLGLRATERSINGGAISMASTAPSSVSNGHVSETESKRRVKSAKSRTASRTSSMYSPFPGAARRSTKRTTNISKRRGVSVRSSLTARTRPEFLRQPTTNSITSFSSEASEPSRILTGEELRAKRTMMLRARRKRSMGVDGGPGRRLTKMSVHARPLPDTASSGD